MRTNAPGGANTSLQINANVLTKSDTARPLIIEPMVVDLDSIRPDNADRKWDFRLAVRNISRENVKAHLVYGPTSLMDIEIPDKEIKPGKERYIELGFDERITDTLFTKSVTIELEDSAKTRYTIPIIKSRRWGPTRH